VLDGGGGGFWSCEAYIKSSTNDFSRISSMCDATRREIRTVGARDCLIE
jgi:hypothetical protein